LIAFDYKLIEVFYYLNQTLKMTDYTFPATKMARFCFERENKQGLAKIEMLKLQRY